MPVYILDLTIPANTAEEKAKLIEAEVEEEIVLAIDVYFPPGCLSLAHVQAFYGLEQLMPRPTGSTYHGDGKLVKGPLNWRCPELPCKLTFKGWNEDTAYEHTPIIFIRTQELEYAPAWNVLRRSQLLLERFLKRVVGV